MPNAHFGRTRKQDLTAGSQHVDLVVRLVLAVLELEQLGDVLGITEKFRGALDYNGVRGILEGRADLAGPFITPQLVE
jgi:hypothetical protein